MEIGSDQQGHGPETTVLLFFAAMFHALQMADFNLIYDVSFKVLTLASLVLVVIINWRKAVYVLTGKNKSKNNTE